MKRGVGALALVVAAAVAASPLAAQSVPFKLPNAPATKEKEPPKDAPEMKPLPPLPPPVAQPTPQVKLPASMNFRERTSEVFGQTIAWFEIGEGPAIVMLHGFAGEAHDWARVMQQFSTTHRVIAFDAPGFGRSAKPAIRYSVETIADFLDGFLAAQRIERATLVGHSVGAWAAARFAQRHPDRVERLIAVAPMGLRSGLSAHLREVLLPTSREEVRQLLPLLYAKEGAARDDAAVDALYARILARGDAVATASILEHGGSLEGELPRGLPFLVIRGDADTLAPELGTPKAEALARPGRVAVVPGCGHMVHFECAAEVAATIRGFLATP